MKKFNFTQLLKKGLTLPYFTLLSLFFMYGTLNGQVTSDNNAQTQTASSSSSVTISNFEVPMGTNRILVVYTFNNGNDNVTGITYNSQNLTQAVQSAGQNLRTEIWYLIMGSGGAVTSNIVVSLDDAPSSNTAGASTYQNVDQSTPIGNSGENSLPGGSQNSSSIALGTSINDMITDAICVSFGEDITDDEGQELFEVVTGFTASASPELATGSSVTASWSWTNNRSFAHAAAELNQFAVLPVELVSFRAGHTPSAVRLTWQTASETNNSGFEIQRSNDGKGWQALSFLTGHGTSHETQSYTYLDGRPLPGLNYYRLKQMDFDGHFEYSQVLSVDLTNLEDLANLRVFPNPIKNGELTLHFPEGLDEPSTVTLYSPSGQVLLQQTVGKLQETLDVSRLPAGMYALQVKNGQAVFYEKIMVL